MATNWLCLFALCSLGLLSPTSTIPTNPPNKEAVPACQLLDYSDGKSLSKNGVDDGGGVITEASGSLRLRGLRILGANRCASGRTLGGTEPVIRKSGNSCSCSTLSPTLLPPPHFPQVSEAGMPTPGPLVRVALRVMCI